MSTNYKSNYVRKKKIKAFSKKASLFLLIFTLILSLIPVSPILAAEDAELLDNGGFEEGKAPWINYRDADTSVTDQEAHSGNNSLHVFDRQSTVDGPQQVITGKVKAGGTYEFSAKVKYTEGPDQKGFNFNIQNGPSWENIDVMESATINKGEWGTIEGTYTVPEDADLSQTFVFIETEYANPADPETDLMDFYVDDASFVDITPNPNILENSSFEEGQEPWTNYGNSTVTVTDQEFNSGANSLLISERQTTTTGPKQDLTGKLEAGKTYEFSARVKYNEGPDQKSFNYNIQNGPTWEYIEVMETATVNKGEWGTIEGSYTIPEDADLTESFIFIETSYADPGDPVNDLMDFYVDDVTFGETLRTAPEDEEPGEIYDGTEAVGKTPGNNNPLMSHKFGADPNAMAYDGRVYVYLTNDEYEYDAEGNVVDNTYAGINTVTVISSDDMVNWTDHGPIPAAGPEGAAPWATNSWAVAVTHKEINGEDKFFLYFSNNGSGIGVLTADSPLGPWKDPIGKPLINGSTPGTEGVVWIFDPAVLVDDDGEGYLYYGGGVPGGGSPSQEQAEHPQTARVIKLSDDMVHTEGEAQLIDSPFHFESSGIHKHDGKYYYSYSTNFSGSRTGDDPGYADISYMTSDNPMGPFTYEGVALRNGSQFFGVGGNNHQDFFNFNGQTYVAYHAQTLGKALDTVQGYRSPHINKVEYDENGKIIDIIADMKGVEQLANLNPYQRTEAETIGWNAGIATQESEAPGSLLESLNLHVTDINDGNWVAVSQADFGENGAKTFEANVASEVGGTIEIRLDSKDGEVIGTLEVAPTGGEQEWVLMETDVTNVTGTHDVYFTFTGEGEDNLFNFDYWKFTEVAGGDETPGDGDETPGDGDETPGDGDETPGDGDETPGDGDESPGDGDETPGDGDETPGDGDETPGDGDETPGDGDETPGDGDETPGDGDETPGDGDETPGDKDSDKDKELPSTATNLFNYLMVGMILVGIGGVIAFYARKRKVNVE
ncbi:carbohydrate binding domain-containing protein [Aquibacillus koreensis]|uniref:Carbohydrate binding domain-containing protein n=1 Tax=Aquibacillus koreensis TaxID=279446 RepID=A0A9X4AIW1_9BACI|nr:carbohydrate binding domain-containing protein [Aquibacillus koreensis]MCT2537219.1 carbohydrate binding domain-containing protein [Aquibacillus koreensis]MDC3421567.1 carbohydrate binding domain-containing protein [Aquibacillus koreensis]